MLFATPPPGPSFEIPDDWWRISARTQRLGKVQRAPTYSNSE